MSTPSSPPSSKPKPISALFYLFFHGGGIGRYTHDLLPSIAAHPDVRVTAACPPDYAWKSEASYPLWTGLYRISHTQPMLRRARFLIGQFVSPRRLVRHAMLMKPDVVHLCQLNQLTYADWGPRLRASGVRIVATIHTVIRRRGVLHPAYEQAMLCRFYREADHLFVHSRRQQEELLAISGIAREKTTVVPMGSSPFPPSMRSREALRAAHRIPEGAQVALLFGDIRPDKNLDMLLWSLPPFRGRLILLVAGRAGRRADEDLAHYQRTARDAGVADMVRFEHRFIPDAEVGDLFTLCDWVALPYSATFSSQSGVQHVAVHFRRPVLGSTAATIGDTMQTHDIGVVTVADDPHDLQRGIAALMERCACDHPHAFEAYERDHSWKMNAARVTEVYRALRDRAWTGG